MNIYLLTRTVPLAGCEDGYRQAVVVADSEEEARNMHPLDGKPLQPKQAEYTPNDPKEVREAYWANYARDNHWVHSVAEVTAVLLGTATVGTNEGVILADLVIND